MTNLFASIFDTAAETIPFSQFGIAVGASLLIGFALAWIYNIKNKSSNSFLISIALLPAIVCVVIMMVNGNLGAGVAVAGAFSLVRFRSQPGSAREISTIFIAMGTGLITGMGYIAYAAVFALVLSTVMALLSFAPFAKGGIDTEKDLRITIPEDLNYSEAFDDILEKYTARNDLLSVKTSNMGSLFKLRYNVVLKDGKSEKEFMDMLRTRNGNLEISMAKPEVITNEL